ncbi:type II toxin-antitoxin system RelE/ParE family toxin [Mesorhizobium mediterraneum]|uniref:Plasmid stabilization protein n=2 Tax=Mesorhizobium TaxID=68287 RepID=A0AB36RGM6_9HYPH|nr:MULTISPECIES: type II toxin-antitoxin system RelE/ParE family toxin [Mesorhizobium]PAQ03668.1 plasmid stabilization protein [Mesorhizobium mediterraneum]RUU25395.1 type II toxin-antitoxin system RelE/ParE family toxin [Mesorhizobium sp. M6A.T.Ce.TU.016.01.1.1]RWN37452.1 MAG: type II toxin-antitoxin system RelE/ParE family toxin [Mesorhizobium sp.]RWO93879.1 MAG: type II toxin-antitoxin system RelE/ParE family toxin [Mesorhizobium sp.]RWP44212.1 MAG: type II toxin-antitoxin system RelE/ParE 
MADILIVRSPAAENDLIEIWFGIATDSPLAADRFLDAIAARILQLASFPESGPKRPDIGAEVRALTIGNYLVLYRLAKQRVEVVRFVHGARDVSALF